MHADVVVVGGGYAGLWTAWAVAEAEPDARVVVLEAETCGAGPSGRNAGFLNGFWHRSDLLCDALRRRRGARGRALPRPAVGRGDRRLGASARGSTSRWRRGGHLKVGDERRPGGGMGRRGRGLRAHRARRRVRPVDAAEAARRCDSPLFRGGAWMPDGATVQPARLALALRAAVLERGVRDLRAHPRALDRARGRRRRRDRDRDRGAAVSGPARRCSPSMPPPPRSAPCARAWR